MLNNPMEVLAQFPVRKSKAQKQAFREAVQAYCAEQGYETRVETAKMGVNNLIIGDPSRAEYLVTAHYDTPASIGLPNILTPCNLLIYILWQFLIIGAFIVAAAVPGALIGIVLDNPDIAGIVAMVIYWTLLLLMMFGPANKSNANDNTSGVVTLLEIMRTMPENQRHRVAFVLFDLEEAGLIGSSAYRKAHKAESENQIILNLDCVGDGNEILLFPSKKLCKDDGKLRHLCSIVSRNGNKTISVCCKGFRVYPSDQKNFPYGVGIAAFHRKKGIGLYCDKIHTKKDTVLDETNVNILRAALTTLICQ